MNFASYILFKIFLSSKLNNFQPARFFIKSNVHTKKGLGSNFGYLTAKTIILVIQCSLPITKSLYNGQNWTKLNSLQIICFIEIISNYFVAELNFTIFHSLTILFITNFLYNALKKTPFSVCYREICCRIQQVFY